VDVGGHAERQYGGIRPGPSHTYTAYARIQPSQGRLILRTEMERITQRQS
jgi:hypothetical protein